VARRPSRARAAPGEAAAGGQVPRRPSLCAGKNPGFEWVATPARGSRASEPICRLEHASRPAWGPGTGRIAIPGTRSGRTAEPLLGKTAIHSATKLVWSSDQVNSSRRACTAPADRARRAHGELRERRPALRARLAPP
jgi:hypothetical protein